MRATSLLTFGYYVPPSLNKGFTILLLLLLLLIIIIIATQCGIDLIERENKKDAHNTRPDTTCMSTARRLLIVFKQTIINNPFYFILHDFRKQLGSIILC